MTANVGVIGLGVLGKPVAERLLTEGFHVAVFDVRPEPMMALAAAGAHACATPGDVALTSDYIITLGIRPSRAEPGFGYIEMGQAIGGSSAVEVNRAAG